MRTGHAAAITARVLIAELDSLEQAAAFEKLSIAEAVRQITGKLRAAVMLAGHVLITDSMLLDGIYFARVPPESLAHLLGISAHDLSLTVVSRQGNLREALAAKQNDSSFTWQIRECHQFDDEQIAAHWERWIESAERGDFRFEQRALDHRSPSDSDRFITSLPDVTWADSLGPESTQLLERSLRMARRSAFLEEFNVARSGANKKQLEQLKSVHDWWMLAYLNELAARNDAGWLHFADEDPVDSAIGKTSRTLSTSSTLRVSGRLIAHLRDAPPPVFGTLMYVARGRRRKFLQRPSRGRLRTLTYAVTDALAAPNRPQILVTGVIHVVFAVLAAAAALPWLPHRVYGIESTWIVFALISAVTIPWRELITLLRLLTANGAAELYPAPLRAPTVRGTAADA